MWYKFTETLIRVYLIAFVKGVEKGSYANSILQHCRLSVRLKLIDVTLWFV